MLCTQGALYIGGDNNIDKCVAAVDNVLFAEEMHSVHIINADVTGNLQTDISFTAFFSMTTWLSRHQKGKPF